MIRTARFALVLLVALGALLFGAFLSAPVPATATPDAPVPSPTTAPVPLPTASPAVPSDGGGDSPAVRVEGEGDSPAVRVEGEGDSPAVPAPAPAVPATDDAGDAFDPAADALPADAPEVCQLLDMGAASCESFVHPAPGEVSVAIIYEAGDEQAIDQIIAYDEHGPVEYVDFWEGTNTPSE